MIKAQDMVYIGRKTKPNSSKLIVTSQLYSQYKAPPSLMANRPPITGTGISVTNVRLAKSNLPPNVRHGWLNPNSEGKPPSRSKQICTKLMGPSAQYFLEPAKETRRVFYQTSDGSIEQDDDATGVWINDDAVFKPVILTAIAT